MNYELSTRGAKQFASASSAQVKAKAADRINQRQPGSFRNYRVCRTNRRQDTRNYFGVEQKTAGIEKTRPA